MKKIFGFIGCGNMGGAIAKAVSASDAYSEILLSDSFNNKVSELASSIGGKVSDNAEVANKADVIFLGVKPQVLAEAISEIKDTLKNRNDVLIVSMAAGTEIARIEELFGYPLPIIRIMPNTPVAVGEGTVLYTSNDKVSTEQEEAFTSSMEHAGMLDSIPEKLIDAASALSGCGPAFVYMFAEALSDGAVACGLPRDKAIKYAAQTILGSSKLLMESGKHPGELKDAVCSPGGSTIAGVRALENGSMRGTAINAVVDAYNRTKELGK